MSFSEFYQRSINEPEQFWAEQARRIDWQTPFTQTLDHSNPPFARWFCEGRTNLCHNAIDRWLEKQPEALALIAVSSETEEERTFTFRQLHDEVNAVASMLRSLGVQRGDRVLVYMPMIAEAHITLLACARIGAIHSVVFGGFASHSVAARIDDAKPVLIVSADAGARGGKIIPYKKLLDDAISQAQHQPRGEVFEQRCQNGSHKIEQHIIAGKRTQQRKAEHCAEAVDDTERQMRKAAVLPPALLPAYDDALHHPAQKAVKEECVDQHMGRHRCGIKNRTHVVHPFCFAACSRDR